MGKGKKKSKVETPREASCDDDAILANAIAERKQHDDKERQRKEEEVEAQTIAAMEQAMKKAALSPEGGLPQFTEKDLVEQLNAIPSFAIMNEKSDGSKSFVPMRFQDDAGAAGPETCAFFIEPTEAKTALLQAKKAAPDLNLVVGVMPLGNAFALAVGWAEAKGSCGFSVRGSPEMAKQVGPQIKKQLESQGLPTTWQFPVLLCEQLQSTTVVPVFLTREGLVATWQACGKEGPPPAKLQVIDMRMLAAKMLAPYQETNLDARIVKFLGSESGWELVEKGLHSKDGKGTAASASDLSDEPPPLEQPPPLESAPTAHTTESASAVAVH